MNHMSLRALMFISLVASPAIAQGQPLQAERTSPTAPSESSDVTRTPRGSWEGWLNHGARDRTSKPYILPRSPDLGMPTAPLSPSIGPGSGLLGPEAGRSPSRLRSDRETELGERGIGSGRR